MNTKRGLGRRAFLRNAGLAAAAAVVGCNKILPGTSDVTKSSSLKASESLTGNLLPKWKGFNIGEYFQPDPYYWGAPTPEEWFKWMADWGFDFVRIPIAYPTYIDMPAYQKYISPDDVYRIDENKVQKLEQLVYTARKYNLHVSFNLHRAPGYCVSTGYQEPYNLWTDQEALNAFCYHWTMWANRFKNYSNRQISFDLVNEPCFRANVNDSNSATSAVPGELYRRIAQTVNSAIWSVNPDALIIADGNNGGSTAVPELADLGIAQSCRGYYPFEISHYKAPWVYPDASYQPYPQWPGDVAGRYFSRTMLEEFYKPWLDLARQGVGVHCGECGAWKETPHDVFLAWFGDVLDILGSAGIGFALWEFSGGVGVLNSERKDVEYEDWYGQKLDRKLLTMLQSK
jgi:aryl-phospho-beta-D-glucosidase BglC (GH1 family)